jgi:hypothetical protein
MFIYLKRKYVGYFIIASWEIWKLRNGKIFDDQRDKAPG